MPGLWREEGGGGLMGIFSRGGQDPRDKVGQNPTGRERKSSAGKRRQSERKSDKDLKGSEWEKKDD